ncbi:hypothetical protein AMTR_s00010p00220130 [Amborella trichopoda]|uniref:Uncharacterized protein n=1 Tax=Amborella trichopoda TaxID=13333 RepID=W1NFK5_AMBTC|nr:hypothetical protein AMTR_s00010p00220130 [Amborella trichopoda]
MWLKNEQYCNQWKCGPSAVYEFVLLNDVDGCNGIAVIALTDVRVSSALDGLSTGQDSSHGPFDPINPSFDDPFYDDLHPKVARISKKGRSTVGGVYF